MLCLPPALRGQTGGGPSIGSVNSGAVPLAGESPGRVPGYPSDQSVLACMWGFPSIGAGRSFLIGPQSPESRDGWSVQICPCPVPRRGVRHRLRGLPRPFGGDSGHGGRYGVRGEHGPEGAERVRVPVLSHHGGGLPGANGRSGQQGRGHGGFLGLVGHGGCSG